MKYIRYMIAAIVTMATPMLATQMVRAEHNISVAQTDSASIMAWTEKWKVAFEAGDAETLRRMYEPDAVLMANGAVPQKGRDAIITFLSRNVKAGNTVTIDFQNEELKIEKDKAYLTAKYWMTITQPSREELNFMGRSFLVFKKNTAQDGEVIWRMWRDMDNLAPDVLASERPSR